MGFENGFVWLEYNWGYALKISRTTYILSFTKAAVVPGQVCLMTYVFGAAIKKAIIVQ